MSDDNLENLETGETGEERWFCKKALHFSSVSPVSQACTPQQWIYWESTKHYPTPTTRLRLSSRRLSRQMPFMYPIRSLRPTMRNPHATCSATLASFSGKIPA